MMRIVFETQLYTGCRFSEASIPLNRIEGNLLWIEDAKRAETDPRKWFRVPLDPDLKRILLPLRGQPSTVPLLTREMNARYNEKLKAAAGVTSHSLRVTFITRCHDAGLSESEAMSLVNHSNSLVHAIYIRRSAGRLRAARARVSLPPPPVRSKTSAPSGSSFSSRKKGSRVSSKR